jgi:hypothetical protein
LLAGCASLSNVGSFRGQSKEDAGLSRVDDLVEEVQRVHFEAEISRERAREAVEELRALVAADFRGDPMASYVAYAEAVERSLEQASSLSERQVPLQEAAEELFEYWDGELGEFSLPSLSQRSRSRMEETQMRYRELEAALADARKAYDTYNTGLSDVATFLGHDFNAAAVNEIQVETKALGNYSRDVDHQLSRVMEAAEAYVGASALPGSVEVAQESVADARR